MTCLPSVTLSEETCHCKHEGKYPRAGNGILFMIILNRHDLGLSNKGFALGRAPVLQDD